MTEERDFLKAILERPDDDTTKLVYADWLEEQGDQRGEYLHLMMKVRQEHNINPEQRQRHKELSTELVDLLSQQQQAWLANQGQSPENRERQRGIQKLQQQLADLSRQMRRQIPPRLHELAAGLDPNWLTVVSDPEIEGCAKGTRGGWSLRFDFVCDKSWADMKPTGDDTVRHCETCSKSVYFCDNLADAREHSMAGHCIAVDLGILRREHDLLPRVMVAGQPSRETLRKTYEEDMDPVSQVRLNARKQGRKKHTGRK